jgi:hypothetical protein
MGHHPDCGRCATKSCATGGGDATGPVQGWRLGAAAFLVFVIPCLLALAGAVYGAGFPAGQLVGAGVGLVAGLSMAWVVLTFAPGRERGS